MTLNNYIKNNPNVFEFTVCDVDYDTECYFYQLDKDADEWDVLLNEFSKLLNVKSVDKNVVVVDMYSLIDSHIDKINNSKLFVRKMDVDRVMDNMNGIISGYVSEDWLKCFINILKGEDTVYEEN